MSWSGSSSILEKGLAEGLNTKRTVETPSKGFYKFLDGQIVDLDKVVAVYDDGAYLSLSVKGLPVPIIPDYNIRSSTPEEDQELIEKLIKDKSAFMKAWTGPSAKIYDMNSVEEGD